MVQNTIPTEKGFRPDHLCVILEKHEIINDALLDMIYPGQRVHFHYTGHPKENKLRLECTPEAMGRLDPVSLWLGGNIDRLEDSMFSQCTKLQDLLLGGANIPILNSRCMNLKRLPLKHLRMNGYGVVLPGEGLNELIQHVRETGGEIETYY